ncbi:hypothetical protein QMZ05_24590 [Bradyrhizobium sp. INPA03-11B]|uniref:hypothetical protein n=1 Tax=Bradyrhizobium sp. INPA03-11B TaxID=418598 RepID=UPI00338EE652
MPILPTDLDDAYSEIYVARARVDEATRAYNKGGSAAAVNKANDRLAAAHDRIYELNAGVVCDRR